MLLLSSSDLSLCFFFFSIKLLSIKWNITSFADHPSQRPVAKPPNHRVTQTDHLTGTGASVGATASAVFPPTLPSPPAVQENRRPTSFGTGFPPAPMQGNFNSPSQSPFGGFGLSGGWGSGVWAPNSSSASGSGGTSPGAHGLQVFLLLFSVVSCEVYLVLSLLRSGIAIV